ncbi:hypothetical protein AB1Y20_001060 [Prymnesium parvum]|uniref:Uncharacterized protein n=1 Tax=Prymnesium parvum TaxID=97485 RepID=A0AB34K6M9_PRYPA
MAAMSAYELQRAANMRANRQQLVSMGLDAPEDRAAVPTATSRKRSRPPPSLHDESALRRSGRTRAPVQHFGDMTRSDELLLRSSPAVRSAAGPLAQTNPHAAFLRASGLRVSEANAHASLGARSSIRPSASVLAAAGRSERPPAEAGSTRSLKLEVASFVERCLGKSVEGPPTKLTVVQALTSKLSPRFSKYSGSLEWANAIVLWVNIGGPDYNNNFLDDGARITWYASPRHSEDTPIVQRLVRSTRAPKSTKLAEQKDDQVLLFCRLPGEPYVCCGRLTYESHNPDVHPIKFVWKLDDIESLRKSAAFREILEVK